jgi:outer membrane biosynthesis protein TonB
MKILQTESEKKAFTITTIVFVLMFLLFFFYKISQSQTVPLLLGGEIAINFGNTDKGKGAVQPKELIETSPEPEVSPQQEAVIAKPEPVASTPVVTQTKVDAPVKVKADNKAKTDIMPAKDVPKTTQKETAKVDPKPSKSTNDALASLINGPKQAGSKSEGHGNSNSGGDQGKINGDMYSNSTYGSGGGQGAGSGASWGLNGRALASRGQVVPDCNEVGTVVVEIRVDKGGRVISAQHTRGTTNSAKCLTDAAIATAKTFKWKADDNAPNVQIGFIVINFKVGS